MIKIHKTIIKLYNSTYDRLIDNGEILNGRWELRSNKTSLYATSRRVFKNDYFQNFSIFKPYMLPLCIKNGI